MKIMGLFFAAISIVESGACFAEPDVHNFSFKGVRFGDSWSSEHRAVNNENLEPWEMDWSNSREVSGYPRIWQKKERDKTQFFFGDFPLDSISYKYFDGRLFEIGVLFSPSIGCENVDEINKMLEIRYAVKFDGKHQKGKGFYESRFENKSISIDVKCDRPILALYDDYDKGGRVVSILFRDAKIYKLTQAYVQETINRWNKESREAADHKVKAKINF